MSHIFFVCHFEEPENVFVSVNSYNNGLVLLPIALALVVYRN